MVPGLFDFTYYRGATDLLSATWRDSNGSAVDLTGYAASMHIRNAADTVLASTSDGITATITAASGLVVFSISDEKGRGLAVGNHRYDVWLVSGGGVDYPILYGNVTVLGEVRSV